MYFWALAYQGAFRRSIPILVLAQNPDQAKTIAEQLWINVTWLTPALGPIPAHIGLEDELEQTKRLRSSARELIRKYLQRQIRQPVVLVNT